jgi:hypothetical protein
MKFWIKTVKNEKTTRDKLLNSNKPLEYDTAFDLLREICQQLHIPTPVFTKTHFENISNFNFVKFRPDDFIEQVDFDYMTVESV